METARFEAYVALCGSGWHGGHRPPDGGRPEAAVDEWEAEDARPQLAQAVPDRMRTAINDARRAVADLVAERPAAAQRVVDELSAWSQYLRRSLKPVTAESAAVRMRSKLDALADRDCGKVLER